MHRDELDTTSVPELLELTQTNVTPDHREALMIATATYERAETPIHRGTAARQAGIRAEQGNEPLEVVQEWFSKSRTALSSEDPEIQRELIATELLSGRALALRILRVGSKMTGLVAETDAAFQRGETIVQQQHIKGERWDRYGTMLARHRATHEAMNGNTTTATATAFRGVWRALRAKKEGNSEEHKAFVRKQLGVNAVAGTLAVSKPLERFQMIAATRSKVALKLLG